MTLSTRQLIEAKEVTADLLEQLGLEAYLFDVEPREGGWEVQVDCAHGGVWLSVAFAVDIHRLLASRTDEATRAQMLKDWGERFAASTRADPAPH